MTPAGDRGADVPACSALSGHEPLPGTAPHTGGWLILEHPGPYGRVAADALGPETAPLRDAVRDAGVTLLLARRPSRDRGGRRAWFARAGRMVSWHDIDPVDLADIDWGQGPEEFAMPTASADDGPILFVCTNGKRDACCARLGRPVVGGLLRDGLPAWECSHIGGHRLAATAVLLPGGSVHGRLDVPTARQVIEEARAGRLHLPSLRGLSHLAPEAQVADIAVRGHAAIPGHVILEVTTTGDERARLCSVRHPDGRAWEVTLRRTIGVPRPESCGKAPVVPGWWTAESVSP
ncbi:MAG: sucrase ferredoxin [bacterium]